MGRHRHATPGEAPSSTGRSRYLLGRTDITTWSLELETTELPLFDATKETYLL